MGVLIVCVLLLGWCDFSPFMMVRAGYELDPYGYSWFGSKSSGPKSSTASGFGLRKRMDLLV